VIGCKYRTFRREYEVTNIEMKMRLFFGRLNEMNIEINERFDDP